jgi:hypothetical protein
MSSGTDQFAQCGVGVTVGVPLAREILRDVLSHREAVAVALIELEGERRVGVGFVLLGEDKVNEEVALGEIVWGTDPLLKEGVNVSVAVWRR